MRYGSGPAIAKAVKEFMNTAYDMVTLEDTLPTARDLRETFWIFPGYPEMLEKVAKSPEFAAYGKSASLVADAYLGGIVHGMMEFWYRAEKERR